MTGAHDPAGRKWIPEGRRGRDAGDQGRRGLVRSRRSRYIACSFLLLWRKAKGPQGGQGGPGSRAAGRSVGKAGDGLGRITLNSIYLTAEKAAHLGFAMLLMVVVARVLGEGGLGNYAYVIALTSLFLPILDLG